MKYYESGMSEALSTNKPQTLAGIDLSGVSGPAKKISAHEVEQHEEEESKGQPPAQTF